MTIGEKLKALRGTKSQEEIATALGITRQALSNYENDIRIPSDDVKIKIAKYFGKTVQEIFFDQNETESYLYEQMDDIVPKVTVQEVNDVLVTTSNRVAEELEVNHRDLLKKIDGYVQKFGVAELSAGFYIPSKYTHPQNKQTYRNYLITEKGIAQLIGGYSGAVPKAFWLNIAYINEFDRMRNLLRGKPTITFEQTLEMVKVIKDTPIKAMPHVFRALKVFVPELEMPEEELRGSKVVRNKSEFQKQLNKYLKENNLTVCSFARKTGLSKSNVWNWANGKVTPSLPNLQIIGEVTDLDINIFIKDV